MSASEMKHFCVTVKTLRETNRLSKTAMAKILGISPSSLNKLENGVMPRISSKVIIRLMEYFHVSAEEVFGDS
jgi:DNA-binding XRE family transcriptional regulator